jgi:hypothetical protein
VAEEALAQAGSLETPADAGSGSAGVVSRWLLELNLADKEEKYWRERAEDASRRYRDESKANDGKPYAMDSRFNILYSNISTICPAIYNQVPKPDVRRRYRDADPVGKEISQILERALSFTMDQYDFDRTMKQAVKDQQVVGRAVDRVKYKPSFKAEKDEKGEAYESVAYEEVCLEHVQWKDFRRGPGRTWEEVGWIAFRHLMTRDEASEEENFGAVAEEAQLDYTPEGVGGDEADKDNQALYDTFKRMIVWEVWDKESRKVIWVAPSLKDKPLKTEDDPLKLQGFFPIPRPLYATDSTDTLVPIEPFRFYRDQAEELDTITRRITGIIDACKVRAIYDATLQEMATLMDASETTMVPAENVLTLAANGGIDKGVWVWPIEKIAAVLVHLYQQREAIKTTIYEITGIADIMRGSSNASETLGAQQLKAQFGTMRIDDLRREVQRYARDLVRLMAEIIAERFQPETLMVMTAVELPTPENKQQAMAMAQQAQQTQQPVPDKVKEVIQKPTWDDALQIMRQDGPRGFRIDIETDSTVTGNIMEEQKQMTELLQGVSAYIAQIGPAVAQGYLPIEAAKSMLLSAIRRFKMGREVEDALDQIGKQEEGAQPKQDPAAMAAQAEAERANQEMQHAQQLAVQKQQADQAIQQQKMQFDQQAAQQKLAFDQQAQTQRIQADTEIARNKAQSEMVMAERELQMKMALAEKEMNMRMQIEGRKAELNAHVADRNGERKAQAASAAA